MNEFEYFRDVFIDTFETCMDEEAEEQESEEGSEEADIFSPSFSSDSSISSIYKNTHKSAIGVVKRRGIISKGWILLLHPKVLDRKLSNSPHRKSIFHSKAVGVVGNGNETNEVSTLNNKQVNDLIPGMSSSFDLDGVNNRNNNMALSLSEQTKVLKDIGDILEYKREKILNLLCCFVKKARAYAERKSRRKEIMKEKVALFKPNGGSGGSACADNFNFHCQNQNQPKNEEDGVSCTGCTFIGTNQQSN
jgi:hypothetical protein